MVPTPLVPTPLTPLTQIPWCVDACFTEGWLWYSETNEIAILCIKQASRHSMLATCGVNTRRLVWSACMLYTIMLTKLCITYVPTNASVRLHQVSHSHCVTIFYALLRNNLYRFLQRCACSCNFIQSFQMSDAFYKSLFFLNYLTLMYNGDQLIWLLLHWNSVCVLSIIFLHNNKKLPRAALKIRIIGLFQNLWSLFRCWSHDKCIVKHLKPWLEQLHVSQRQYPPPADSSFAFCSF